MKMMMLLLVPAVALLASLTVANPTHHNPVNNLYHMIDQAKVYNDTLTKEIFVEDVSLLAEGSDSCGDKFFCKVHKILLDRQHDHRRSGEKDILKNLDLYIHASHVNCTEVLKEVTPSSETKPIHVLVAFLLKCCKQKNFNGK